MMTYEGLRSLLAKETFPHPFSFKFIGKNSVPFNQGAEALLQRFPQLVSEARRLSQNQNHVSYTYSCQAESADLIIDIFRAIAGIPDISMVL